MAEATAYTGCSERTLRRYVSAGRLPAYRLGLRDHADWHSVWWIWTRWFSRFPR
ncbi:helix-turn-helix domain-containing protein [Sporichthya sp.]|uniref:helix-turn-helix domain-containing protein n=1 Tax=Sporichthya sp. TaxID=65475 RepID=UPI00345BE977